MWALTKSTTTEAPYSRSNLCGAGGGGGKSRCHFGLRHAELFQGAAAHNEDMFSLQ